MNWRGTLLKNHPSLTRIASPLITSTIDESSSMFWLHRPRSKTITNLRQHLQTAGSSCVSAQESHYVFVYHCPSFCCCHNFDHHFPVRLSTRSVSCCWWWDDDNDKKVMNDGYALDAMKDDGGRASCLWRWCCCCCHSRRPAGQDRGHWRLELCLMMHKCECCDYCCELMPKDLRSKSLLTKTFDEHKTIKVISINVEKDKMKSEKNKQK